VSVTAWDLNGLPNGTTVTLDVDTNNDGNFTDPGETGYASGSLTDGAATITLPTLPGLGTYTLEARVTDRAGNQGTSATATLQVVSNTPWVLTAQTLSSDPKGGLALQQLGDTSTSQPVHIDQSTCGCAVGNPDLVQHSMSTGVLPLVPVSLSTDPAQSLPATITEQLTFNGVTQTAVTYSTTGFSPGDTLTAALQDTSTTITASGRYPWSVTATMNYATPIVRTVTGVAYEVSEDSSPLGAGWALSDQDQLVNIPADGNGPAGQLRLYGTGGWRFYQSLGGGSFQSPAGDNGTLTQSGGAFTYTTPDGQTTAFNSSGYETSWTSADGEQTLLFRYNGSNNLTGMTAPDGTLTTFSYTGGLVTQILTGNSRTTTLSFSGTNLTQITNPDGGLHTFSYDSYHHLTGETFGLLQDEWSYNSAGVLATYTWGSSTGPGGASNPSTWSVHAAIAYGLGGLAAWFPQASVTDPDGHTTTWQLDSGGRPLQETAADGGVTSWAYSNGFLTSVTDPLGRTTTLALDGWDYPTQVTLPDGNTLQLAYQSAYHALTTFTDERGSTSTYAYDPSTGHLTSATDALGDTTTFGWTAQGEVQSVTDALTHTTTYGYDAWRRLTSVKDPLGDVTNYHYDGNGFPLTTTDALLRVATTSYDVIGRLTGTTDPLGGQTTATYDASGLPLTATDELGHKASLGYDGFHRGLVTLTTVASGTPAQATTLDVYDAAGYLTKERDALGWWTSYAYDPVGRLSQVTDPLGGVSLVSYDLAGQATATRDELGRWTKDAYNPRGWLTQVTDALGGLTTLAYDASGDLTAVTDPLGHTTSYGYDKLFQMTAVTDPLGHTTTISFDKVGNVTSVTDPLGVVTSFVYDAGDRLTQETDAVGTAVQRALTWAYDAVGNLTAFTDGLGHTTTYAFDKLDRVTTITDPLSHVSTAQYDAASDLTATVDALGKTTTYTYDGQDRRVAVTDPLGHTTTGVLDALGQQVAGIDPLWDVSRTVYDPLGRPVLSVDPRGAVDQVAYDTASNAVGVIDPVGNSTTYLYDALDRPVVATDPYGKATTTAYDAASRVTSVTDRLNRVITYAYDNADRLTGETWLSAGGTTVVNTRTYTYDNADQLLTAGDNSGTYTLGYDALGRVTGESEPFGLSLTYSYDAADRLTLEQDSLGGVLTSVYDNADRLTSRQLSGNGQQARIDPGYDARDELTSLTRYSDTGGTTVVGTTVYGYDDAGRTTAITHKNASGATLSYYDYGYDNADRITTETWGSGASTGVHSYTYDNASQLSGDGSTTYSYDFNGNRTMAGYSTATGNRLTTDGVWTYTYDAEGNLVQKTQGSGGSQVTWSYGYDNLDRLVSVTEVTGGTTTALQLTYSYDVFDQRIEEDRWTAATGTVTTRTAYDDAGNAWADVDGSNNVKARYLWGDNGELWARAVPAGQTNPGVAWYLADVRGSVRDLMDNTGTIRDHLDYDGYGKVTETNAGYGDEYKYDAGRYDAGTGLTLFGLRYYDAATGRWTSQDPLGFAAGDGNLYRYVRNGPTDGTDPGGLEERELKGDPAHRFDFLHLPPEPEYVPPMTAGLQAMAEYLGEDLQSLGNFIYDMIDSSLEAVRMGGDVIRCGQFAVEKAVGMSPDVPEWHSEFAKNAPPPNDIKANWEYFKKAELDNLKDGAIQVGTLGAIKGVGAAGEKWLARRVEGRLASEVENEVVQSRRMPIQLIGQRSCFVAGTRLLTPDGDKPIELLRPGDLVLSRSEHDMEGSVEGRPVVDTFVRVALILELHVGNRAIRTTVEHPFYVAGRGWVAATHLCPGEFLCSHDGSLWPLDRIVATRELATVYNVQVDEYHTYFVGYEEWGFSVWAHNAEYVVGKPIGGGWYEIIDRETGDVVKKIQGFANAKTEAARLTQEAAGEVRGIKREPSGASKAPGQQYEEILDAQRKKGRNPIRETKKSQQMDREELANEAEQALEDIRRRRQQGNNP
jgi:RHS repeat-associated protein